MEPIKQVINNLAVTGQLYPTFRRQKFNDDDIKTLKWEFILLAREFFFQEGGEVVLSEDEKTKMNQIFNWLIGKGIDFSLNKGLLLTGDYGTGKSVLIKACIKFIDRYYSDKAVPNGITEPIYISSHDLANAFEETKSALITRMKVTSILAIDDLGYEPLEVNSFGTIIKPFEEIIMARYDKRKTILLTTNLTLDEIGERYRGHIHDRLRQMTYVIEFNGKSKR